MKTFQSPRTGRSGRYVYPSLWNGCVAAVAPQRLSGGIADAREDSRWHHNISMQGIDGADIIREQGFPAIDCDSASNEFFYLPSLDRQFAFPLTMIAWLRTDGAGTIASQRDDTDRGWQWWFSGANMIFTINDGSSWTNINNYNDARVSVLSFYAARITTSLCTLYSSAYGSSTLATDSAANSALINWTTSVPLTIMARGGGLPTPGYLQDGAFVEFRMYDRALTDQEIYLLSRRPFASYRIRKSFVLRSGVLAEENSSSSSASSLSSVSSASSASSVSSASSASSESSISSASSDSSASSISSASSDSSASSISSLSSESSASSVSSASSASSESSISSLSSTSQSSQSESNSSSDSSDSSVSSSSVSSLSSQSSQSESSASSQSSASSVSSVSGDSSSSQSQSSDSSQSASSSLSSSSASESSYSGSLSFSSVSDSSSSFAGTTIIHPGSMTIVSTTAMSMTIRQRSYLD